MVKDMIDDPIFLARKSEVATKEDFQAAQDLLDTLIAHKDSCVGMAANMIGVRKRIIVFDNEGTYMIMFNPRLSKSQGRMIPKKISFSTRRLSQIQALSGPQSTMANRRISNPNQNLYWFTDCSTHN